MEYPFSTSRFLIIYAVFAFTITCITTEIVDDKVIFDITRIIQEEQQTGRGEALRKLQAVAEQVTAKEATFLMYYETDFQSMVTTNLGKVIELVKEVKADNSGLTPKLLLSIKDEQWKGRNENIDAYLKKRYLNILYIVSQNVDIFFGISVELSAVGNICKQNFGRSKDIKSILHEIRRLVVQQKYETFNSTGTQIGYVVHRKNLDCNIHTQSLQEANYLVVNVPLQLNDKIFVESYGIFKENMKSIQEAITTSQSGYLKDKSVNQTIYYRISLNAILDRGRLTPTRIYDKNRIVPIPKNQRALDYVLKQIRLRNQVIARKYEILLTKFIYEWTNRNSRDPKVILNYLHGYTSYTLTREGVNWMTSEECAVIPYLTNLPALMGSRNYSVFRTPASVRIILEDFANSEFDTVMINGQNWKALASNRNYFESCIQTGCKPIKVLYKIDENNPFSVPVKSDIENLHTIGGMELTTLIFSYQYSANLSYSAHNVSTLFKELTRGTQLLNQRIHLACQMWKGSVKSLSLNGNHACIADIIQFVYGCPIVHLTETFIWSIIFDFENGQVENFVDGTMNLLDAYVIARQILWLKYPNKTVILEFGSEHTGSKTTGTETNLYCTNLGERFGQFYDAILTWSRIHDFPVILQTADGVAAYGNPFSLSEIKTTVNDRKQEMMQSGPLYVRRSYNQSTVFGAWAKGTYPCITKAIDQTSIKSINFDHAFVGVTLNLNLRTDNVSMEMDELETLLLFSLGKFSKVEIIFQEDEQIELVKKTISNPSFKVTINQNGLRDRKIFLHFQNGSKKSFENLKRVASLFENNGIASGVISYFDSNASSDSSVKTDIVHSDCMDLAYQIVLRNQSLNENFRNVRYLICNTDPIPAENTDEIRMQEYLDSHLHLKKLIGHFYPNLKEIHFRLHPTFRDGVILEKKIENLFLFLSDLNTYSKAYKIHYFLLPAFVTADQTDLEPSFWNIFDYTNLANISIYQDNHAAFLNQVTWIPTISDYKHPPTHLPMHNNHTHNHKQEAQKETKKISDSFGLSKEDFIIYIIAVISLVILTLIIVICVWNKQRHYLSAQDTREFQHGRQETLERAVTELRRNKLYSDNIFDGLVFQTDRELSKKDVELDTKNVLRKGKFYTAYHGMLGKKKMDVLVKIPKRSCTKRVFKAILSEVKLLCYIGEHSNILGFIGCHTKDIRKGVLWIVMEFCEGGTLLEHLKRRKDVKADEWSAHELIRFSREIASGMEYVAEQNVIHGNLCAKNVLLNQYNTCKVKGFRLNEKLQVYQVYSKKSQLEKLPWQWMAPESLKSLEFSLKSDIWSYGVTLWEIFSLGETPYRGESLTANFIDGLVKGNRMASPDYTKKEIYDVMLTCWKKEPEQRQEFPELVKYFTDFMPKAVC